MSERTEQEVIIDDKVIDEGGPMEVIDPVWWSVDNDIEMYEKDLAKWSNEQRYIYAIEWYNTEVNNGGHDQFFWNSSGVVWEDAVKGFDAIGLKDYAANLRQAALFHGGYLSKNREKREEQLDELLKDNGLWFEQFDSRFYKLYEENPLFEAEMNYIRSNRDKFYFNGIILRPDTSKWNDFMLETLKKYPPASQA